MTDFKLKIFVVADDLTGAAEIGGIAQQFGLTARILSGKEKHISFQENVIIINTSSRSYEPQQAKKAIGDVLSGHNLAEYDLIYKKIDSVLRGPVVPETMALLTESGYSRVLMIPANPSRNRIIQDGRYFLDGIPVNETSFRNDPLHPRLSAKVRYLLGNHESVVLGRDIDFLSKGKIFVPDISSERDISKLLLEISLSDVLLAGGADLYRAVLSVNMGLTTTKNQVITFNTGDNHFIIGSRSETSLKSVSCLLRTGYTFFALPLQAIRDENVFLKWTEKIRNKVRAGSKVVITGPSLTVDKIDEVAMITRKLAQAGKVIIENAKPGTHFYLEGGETASAFVREMSWNSLVVTETYDLGVVTLHPEGREALITVKPGSYPWPSNSLNDIRKT